MSAWRSIAVSAVPLVVFVVAAAWFILATCDGEFGVCLDAVVGRP
jgi:hypothetical protein